VLRRSRVRGPALVRFAAAVHVGGGRLLGDRRRSATSRPRRDAQLLERVEVGAGERLEVRP
jgi:hypothetical protein